ncbi:MAG: hypothetical protein RMZ41_002445 [Nostoc sp. DedVER02]|uniref:hypothetical protein n=1 Tax=unclassified Nostoc TaxID=2593658 RepID=UPI002AD3489A|nr:MULTISPECIES: hypothetical protein [unclassified Nostoc]MDZ7986983.1 hypothetical protein [Nostoc sp. DedVER02]MDZ8116501.1 hypothetical protein [Nostoc sp. DedVER01b]
MQDKFPAIERSALEVIQTALTYYLNNLPSQLSEGQLYVLKNIIEDVEKSLEDKNCYEEKTKCIYCNGTGYIENSSYSI